MEECSVSCAFLGASVCPYSGVNITLSTYIYLKKRRRLRIMGFRCVNYEVLHL